VGKWSGLSGEPVSSEPVTSEPVSIEPVSSELSGSERGSVAAEFAAVIPAVILILVFGLTSLQLAGQQVRLQDAAADAARILGRGDSPALAAEVAHRAAAGARISTTRPSGLVCVTLAAPAQSPAGTALGLELSARSCALDAGG
jgi:Flp pilus assembly protein TadG